MVSPVFLVTLICAKQSAAKHPANEQYFTGNLRDALVGKLVNSTLKVSLYFHSYLENTTIARGPNRFAPPWSSRSSTRVVPSFARNSIVSSIARMQSFGLQTMNQRTSRQYRNIFHLPPMVWHHHGEMHARLAVAASREVTGAASDKHITFVERPLMPFHVTELLLPGQTRYCHLYEARFLSLMEYAQEHCDGEVVMGLMSGAGFLKLALLSRIDRFERLEIGVGATLRGLRPVMLDEVVDMASDDRDNAFKPTEQLPFLLAKYVNNNTVQATVNESLESAKLADAVLATHRSVQQLERKAGVDSAEAQELSIDPRSFADLLNGSASSALDQPSPSPADDNPASDLELRARTAYAAMSGSILVPARELHTLVSYLAFEGANTQLKINALITSSLDARLAAAANFLQERQSELAAKAAIKSLNLMQGDADTASDTES